MVPDAHFRGQLDEEVLESTLQEDAVSSNLMLASLQLHVLIKNSLIG